MGDLRQGTVYSRRVLCPRILLLTTFPSFPPAFSPSILPSLPPPSHLPSLYPPLFPSSSSPPHSPSFPFSLLLLSSFPPPPPRRLHPSSPPLPSPLRPSLLAPSPPSPPLPRLLPLRPSPFFSFNVSVCLVVDVVGCLLLLLLLLLLWWWWYKGVRWSGNIWASTGCESKVGCETASCLRNKGYPDGYCPPSTGPTGPVTKAEFTLVRGGGGRGKEGR